jgi:hypothetical protein
MVYDIVIHPRGGVTQALEVGRGEVGALAVELRHRR